ncbi:DUF3592 domain-containing protein [Streptomyces sp. NPDC002573]|uniref:DUF3592 domain-containing protein n=1 Tax=Streptomyces sp. NPDC002573 TaxID=3364651 RepID=UPI0036BCF66C
MLLSSRVAAVQKARGINMTDTTGAIIGTLVAAAPFILVSRQVRWWHRRWTVLRNGERVIGRCVRGYRYEDSSHMKFDVEYAVPGGATHQIYVSGLPSTTREGDLLTVAYDPRRPADGFVVPPRIQPVDGVTVALAIFILFALIFSAGALAIAISAM